MGWEEENRMKLINLLKTPYLERLDREALITSIRKSRKVRPFKKETKKKLPEFSKLEINELKMLMEILKTEKESRDE